MLLAYPPLSPVVQTKSRFKHWKTFCGEQNCPWLRATVIEYGGNEKLGHERPLSILVLLGHLFWEIPIAMEI